MLEVAVIILLVLQCYSFNYGYKSLIELGPSGNVFKQFLFSDARDIQFSVFVHDQPYQPGG
jgi:hypothetical protein